MWYRHVHPPRICAHSTFTAPPGVPLSVRAPYWQCDWRRWRAASQLIQTPSSPPGLALHARDTPDARTSVRPLSVPWVPPRTLSVLPTAVRGFQLVGCIRGLAAMPTRHFRTACADAPYRAVIYFAVGVVFIRPSATFFAALELSGHMLGSSARSGFARARVEREIPYTPNVILRWCTRPPPPPIAEGGYYEDAPTARASITLVGAFDADPAVLILARDESLLELALAYVVKWVERAVSTLGSIRQDSTLGSGCGQGEMGVEDARLPAVDLEHLARVPHASRTSASLSPHASLSVRLVCGLAYLPLAVSAETRSHDREGGEGRDDGRLTVLALVSVPPTAVFRPQIFSTSRHPRTGCPARVLHAPLPILAPCHSPSHRPYCAYTCAFAPLHACSSVIELAPSSRMWCSWTATAPTSRALFTHLPTLPANLVAAQPGVSGSTSTSRAETGRNDWEEKDASKHAGDTRECRIPHRAGGGWNHARKCRYVLFFVTWRYGILIPVLVWLLSSQILVLEDYGQRIHGGRTTELELD
ncbi:hypothetical protein B0H16DRAFT_1718471 [Mycena metata]|uniref:Uncharacterized protein n=1 Tax=Mycena metata TaxID=1033252 RepID=A0AAD7NK73_9AGAR|nr:hypothetical protein B0H16DRAFT_1718471 [Mycena metata]